ncbi:MAG: membrane-bound dehydrogenase [Limisphaerales bacterium]|nr:MAG: membrane-bound dehydrogenase [Limisphaerales bacterium]KAG0509046.1 MAG: membrane-bound dehydrogenase [Limisphaerales bacterium]TXT47721.1 MAG: membrane-bound dehydrogenase [Limisphaerales bacterium]
MNSDSPAPRAGGLQPPSEASVSATSGDSKSPARALAFAFAVLCFFAACAVRHATARRLPSVGVARVDITPDYPIRLTGFAVRKTESEGVAQRIHAKALAIGTDAEGPAVLVTVDNLGVSDAIRTELLRRLANTRLTHDRLAICSSHTHSAPMIAGVAPNIFMADLSPDQQSRVDRYTRELTFKLEQVIRAALADRRPSRVEWTQGKVGFAMNRRARPIAPVDHDLPVLRVVAPEGIVRAVFVSYACHCVTLGLNTVHGDWAGSAQLALEADHPGAIGLVAIGCGADQNPNKRGTPDLADALGGQIANEVKRLFPGSWKELPTTPTARTKRIALDFDNLPTRAEWEALATNKAQQISYHAKKNLTRLDRGETLPTKLPYLIQTWHFGTNLALVFLPGEVVVDYGLRLKREFDSTRLWVHGYANDAPCYIPSERILQEGGYEAGGAMVYYDRPTKFAPGLENKIVGAAHELLPRDFVSKTTNAPAATAPRAGDLQSPSAASSTPERRLQTAGTTLAGTGNPPPKSPTDSLATLRTKPGLTIELVAAEPLVTSPVAIDFGTDGKLWVVEMADYPMGSDGNWKPGGRVKSLTRSRPDGPFDRATLFLDGLPFPTGVMAWRKGALICAAPDIIYAEDTNGDGKADVVRKLYTGFETNNYQARVNSLSLGLDNWVHGANGLLGGDIAVGDDVRSLTSESAIANRQSPTSQSLLTSAATKAVNIRGRDFRFRPDTGEFEATSGLTQQGRARDDFGNWFGCHNSTFAYHYPLPDRYLARNPHVPAPPPSVNLAASLARLNPVSTPLERFNSPQSLNHVTSACGLGVYRDTLLGAGFSQNLFVCEPVHNLVRRLVLTPNGVTFTAARAADEVQSEFLASTDNWFRPVQALTGPDGALWVVDMYRFVIEHPRWIPPDRLKTLDVRAGSDKGRIYRIYPQGAKLRPFNDLTKLTTAQVVAALNTENGVARDLVHRELLHRADPTTEAELAQLFGSSPNPTVRLQALALLNEWIEPRAIAAAVSFVTKPRVPDQDWTVENTLLLRALNDPHPSVRRFALRLLEPRLATDEFSQRALLNRVEERDPTVRYQLAFTLGTWSDPRATAVLAQLAREGMGDPYQRAAILSGAVGRTGELLKVAVTAPATAPGRNEFLGQLIATASASASDTEFASLLTALAPAEGKRTQQWQLYAMTALQDAFDTRGLALTKFTASPSTEIRAAVKRLEQLYADARTFAASPKSSDATRRASVPLLGRGFNRPDADAPIVAGLLVPPASDALQQVALTTLRTRRWAGTDELILAQWAALPVATRPAVVELLASQESWTQSLLNAVERGVVGLAEIPPATRNRLRWHGSDATKARVVKLFPEQTASRATVLASYATVPSLKGDAKKGAALFTASCAACHAYRGLGHALGPDLATFRTKPVGDFLTAILDPNAAIEPRYIAYNVDTKDDRALTGLVTDETATGFTLAQANGVKDKLLRPNVKTLRPSPLSLMPEGLEAALPPPAMADLLAWLRE